MKEKTIDGFSGEARNLVYEFKKLVAAFCGVDVDDVQISVKIKGGEEDV